MTTNNHRDTMPEPRPLWKVMERAYPSPEKIRVPSAENLSRQIYAAEIRAIAREIAKRDPDNAMSALAVEEWLLAEAERAEQGDDVQRHLDDFQNRHAADFQALAGE